MNYSLLLWYHKKDNLLLKIGITNNVKQHCVNISFAGLILNFTPELYFEHFNLYGYFTHETILNFDIIQREIDHFTYYYIYSYLKDIKIQRKREFLFVFLLYLLNIEKKHRVKINENK